MEVDWGQASQIAGAGFGTILAGVIALIALAVRRTSRGKDKNIKKGD